MRVEPDIIANEVAAGTVSLAFNPVLDHGDSSSLAHRTAECAGAQSPLAFWQMHNLLFERQNEVWYSGEEVVMQLTDELGLDADAMRTCLDDPVINDKIVRLDQMRRDQGIRLRPSFDINGKVVEGAIQYAQFQQVFAEALAQ